MIFVCSKCNGVILENCLQTFLYRPISYPATQFIIQLKFQKLLGRDLHYPVSSEVYE
jgi:hypothetical protein